MKNSEDTILQKDTVTSTNFVKMTKLVPANKVKIIDGAIIPKEALSMTKIQPSIPRKKEEFLGLPSNYVIVFGVVILILTIVIIYRIKRSSKNKPELKK